MKSSRKVGKKSKKPLETTLGQASKEKVEAVDDDSHLQKPIHTNICGLKKFVNVLQQGTKEVQHFLNYECDIMYECKICRSIFRSFANFILHKRKYCLDRYDISKLHKDDDEEKEEEKMTTEQENLESAEDDSENSTNTSPLKSVVDKLQAKLHIDQLTDEHIKEDLSKEQPETEKRIEDINVQLQQISSNTSACFQTVSANDHETKEESMKSEVLEIYNILENNEAVLGKDGKIITRGYLSCKECHQMFFTKKTLSYHVKYKHNPSRLVFVCPDCKQTFANSWGVYRHLYKVHRYNVEKVRKVRAAIYDSVVRRDQQPSITKKVELKAINKSDNLENQWMDNIEGDKDIQMCGGCGKRFERKAALYSHAQMCAKRIAVCNSIKDNAKKKEKDKSNKEKVVKGSAKRKPCEPLKKIKNKNENTTDEINANQDDTCDSNWTTNETLEPIDTEQIFDIIGVDPEYITRETKTYDNEIEDEICDKSNDKDRKLSKPLKQSNLNNPQTVRKNSRKKQSKAVETIKKTKPILDNTGFIQRAFPYINRKRLLCVPCQARFSNYYKLLWHMSEHFSWYRFQCSRCSFLTYSKSDCVKHARVNHKMGFRKAAWRVVLPIPEWKAKMMSHDFMEIGTKPEIIYVESENVEKVIENENRDKIVDENTSNEIVGNENINEIEENSDIEIIIENSEENQDNKNEIEVIEIDDEDIFGTEAEGLEEFRKEPPSVHNECNLNKMKSEQDEEITELENTDSNFSFPFIIQDVTTVTEDDDTYVIEIPDDFPPSPLAIDPLENLRQVPEGIIKSEPESDFGNSDSSSDIFKIEHSDGCENGLVNQIKVEEDVIKVEIKTEPTVRPKRNRMVSTKLLSQDFVYDLSKVVRLNSSSQKNKSRRSK